MNNPMLPTDPATLARVEHRPAQDVFDEIVEALL